MSDRTANLTVVLNSEYRVDDAQEIMQAIRMIKGVATVKPNVANIDTYVAYSRARLDLEQRLYKALKEKNNE